MPKGVYGTRNWTPAQCDAVREGIARGQSYATIAKRIGRTENAVQIWCKRNIDRVRDERPMSARDLHRLMGVSEDGKWAQSLIRNGWLKAQRGYKTGRSRLWVITEEALMNFLENPEHWHRWNQRKIRDRAIREWATEMRTERYYTVGQVAQRYSVSVGTVGSWIARGDIKTVRWGNHYIPESALADFVPPYERPRAGGKVRRFTRGEDARLLAMRATGATWEAIAAALGRPLSSCYGRYARVTGRREAVAA